MLHVHIITDAMSGRRAGLRNTHYGIAGSFVVGVFAIVVTSMETGMAHLGVAQLIGLSVDSDLATLASLSSTHGVMTRTWFDEF